jgi:N,N'-diacetyllegionaminate synthase
MTGQVLIIAEAGVNHNGSLEMAKQLIVAAREAGADVIKFQSFNADRLVTKDAQKAEYQKQNSGEHESQYQMLKRLELSESMHRELIVYSLQKEISFFSTGFDTESVDMLVSLGQTRFKIPSGEITNLPYLRHIGALGYPVILSTGMAKLGEIEAALDVLQIAGCPRDNITVLHCTTEYPTPMREVNLRAMQNIGQTLGVAVGYSDHTAGYEVAVAAVALGATVIEKHFTLDRQLPGPDHQASLEPQELKAMVNAIRNIEAALGDGIKRPTTSEQKNKAIVRKSLVASQEIQAGDILSLDNIAVKRPGSGISPMRIDEILGRKATRNYVIDELINE